MDTALIAHIAHHVHGRTRLRVPHHNPHELARQITESTDIPGSARVGANNSVIIDHPQPLADLVAQLEAAGIARALDLPTEAQEQLRYLGPLPLTLAVLGLLGGAWWWMRA
jgi:hypothetical protein